VYSLHHFRGWLYAVILMGLLGYGIALESVPHFVFGAGFTLLHLWLTRGGRPVTLPRVVAGSIALVAGMFSVVGALRGHMAPLMAISQWLFVLLLVTMWSRQDNRSYSQMLVMSLVIMVAGAINTASVFYGILLILYLFASLYCCLLFHLKVEAEHAAKAAQLPPDLPATSATTQEQLAFGRSMRKVTALVSGAAVFMGLLVFLFFPRSKASGLLMQMQPGESAPLTGFSEHMSFEQVARINQNPQVVAHVTIEGTTRPQEWYLRGTTLDIYTGNVPDRPELSWQWVRSPATAIGLRAAQAAPATPVVLREATPTAPLIHQTIVLQPSGTATVFAIDGASVITFDRTLDLAYMPRDATVRLASLPPSPLRYEVLSTGSTPEATPSGELDESLEPGGFGRGFGRHFRHFRMPTRSNIDPRIYAVALQADVSGQNAGGLLADQRGERSGPSTLDEQIARNIEHYFQSNFSYTLDLTDTQRQPNEDPIVAFLTNYKRGHCEYFAGAMTLLCQSLGLQARVVLGFHFGPEDFNQLAGYYVVRQAHAHAWVEVLTPSGWKRFDPTPGGVTTLPRRSAPMRRVHDFLDYVQYNWANSVVSYNNESRINLLDTLDGQFSNASSAARRLYEDAKEYLFSASGYYLSSELLLGGICISLLILLTAIAMFIVEKQRLRRRAARMGLEMLSSDDQLRMARQLAFYDSLTQLLERHRIRRPAHQTPLEFAASLHFLPKTAYLHIAGLTRVYYRVRYGQHVLSTAQQRSLQTTLHRLAHLMTHHSNGTTPIRQT
jgi:transglutaminase-like putative cysteine protease